MKNDIEFVDVLNQNIEKLRSKIFKRYKLTVNIIRFVPLFFILCMPFNFILNILLSVGWFIVSTIFFDHRIIRSFEPTIRVWFGVPGAGKTSVASYLTKHSIDSKYTVVSNVAIKGALKLDNGDLGKYDMSFGGDGCHVVYDEASMDFDNRNFKQFAKTDSPLYFSIHRHMNNRVDVFSQGYDIDKRIRDRVGPQGLFHLSKINLKGFVMYRRIKKILFIRKDDKQIIDGFEYTGLPRILYVKSIWKNFDTLDADKCPKEIKQWEKW